MELVAFVLFLAAIAGLAWLGVVPSRGSIPFLILLAVAFFAGFAAFQPNAVAWLCLFLSATLPVSAGAAFLSKWLDDPLEAYLASLVGEIISAMALGPLLYLLLLVVTHPEG